MADQPKQSMPGYQPTTLSTDETVNFVPPAFATTGQSIDSQFPVEQTQPIPKSLPPRAAGTPLPMAASAVSDAPAASIPSNELAERLILHALGIVEASPEQLSPLDVALAKSALLILDLMQDKIKGLLPPTRSAAPAPRRARKKSARKTRKR